MPKLPENNSNKEADSSKTQPFFPTLGMYIIKVKGKAKIPDYIQIRDENFVLVAYFRADRPLKNIEKFGLEGKEDQLEEVIKNLPFGKLQKLDL
jgi:hypothetical protein